jgi:hypothetical protein
LLAISSCAAANAAGVHVLGEDYCKSLLSLFPWSKNKASASDPQQVTFLD